MQLMTLKSAIVFARRHPTSFDGSANILSQSFNFSFQLLPSLTLFPSMDVKSTYKYARISPFKAREVAREIQGLPVSDALDILNFTPRKAARFLGKTMKAALADAENNFELDLETLTVKEATVGDGPTFKRFKPRARGSAAAIRKRTAHLYIILTDEAPLPEPKRKSSAASKQKAKAKAKPAAPKQKAAKPAKAEEAEAEVEVKDADVEVAAAETPKPESKPKAEMKAEAAAEPKAEPAADADAEPAAEADDTTEAKD